MSRHSVELDLFGWLRVMGMGQGVGVGGVAGGRDFPEVWKDRIY